MTRSHLPHLLIVVCLSFVFAACAPRTTSAPEPAAEPVLELSSESAQAAERTATIAFHKMAIGFLETGTYTTEALIDLVPPQGVRFTLESLASDSYALRFSSDEVPGVIWRVSPEGVVASAESGT